MTDYADLVKRLRERADDYEAHEALYFSIALIHEAADALERVTRKLEEVETLGRAVYESEPQGAVFLLDEDTVHFNK